MAGYTPVEGATAPYSAGLQGGKDASILVLGPRALVKWSGYRGRSGGYYLFRDGVREVAPPALLLALGKISADVQPRSIQAPPLLSTAMAEAMERARRAEG